MSELWSVSEAGRQPAGTLVSVTTPCPGVSPTALLRTARGQARFFWEDNQDPVTFAAFGIAADLIGWGPNRFRQIENQARALFDKALLTPALLDNDPLAAPRLFGGFAFRQDFAPDNTWSIFRPAHFILPHYQLLQHGGDTFLTLNSIVPEEEDPRSAVAPLEEAVAARADQLRLAAAGLDVLPPQPPVAALRYPLNQEAWAMMIDAATGAMTRDTLQKVVLARVCEVRLKERVNVDRSLAFLNDAYPGTFRFLFEPRADHAFFGATPELLARVAGRTVETAGLAGSAPRGATAEEDERLAAELLESPKDRYEHAVVVDAITRRLTPLSRQVTAPTAPTIVTLPNIHHLYTPIRAALRRETGVLPLVEALHPTPALGGAPRRQAMTFIQETEPVPRGWYAAPIGWIDHRLEGTFAVAIRSAVTQYERVWLYAGAGIVSESVAEREWAETGLKFAPMLEALDAQPELVRPT